MRRAAGMRYSRHLVIYRQIRGRVVYLKFVLSMEAELLTSRTAAGLPIHSHHFWCSCGSAASWSSCLSGWKLIRIFGMGFFVVNKIMWWSSRLATMQATTQENWWKWWVWGMVNQEYWLCTVCFSDTDGESAPGLHVCSEIILVTFKTFYAWINVF